MTFAVKCSRHYPGYEIANAPSLELLKSQFPSWRTCEVDASAVETVPDGFDLAKEPKEGEEGFDLKNKLDGWTKEFTDRH